MPRDPERKAIQEYQQPDESYEAALARASKAALDQLALERAPLQQRLDELRNLTAARAIKVMALDALKKQDDAQAEREILQRDLSEAEEIKGQIEQINLVMSRCGQAAETYGV